MSGSSFRGGFGSLTPRSYGESRPAAAPAGGAFAALLSSPAERSFVMPSAAVLALIAPRGVGDVTITLPSGEVKRLHGQGLQGNRVATSQPVPKGSRVDVDAGLEVQVSVGPLEWATVARG